MQEMTIPDVHNTSRTTRLPHNHYLSFHGKLRAWPSAAAAAAAKGTKRAPSGRRWQSNFSRSHGFVASIMSTQRVVCLPWVGGQRPYSAFGLLHADRALHESTCPVVVWQFSGGTQARLVASSLTTLTLDVVGIEEVQEVRPSSAAASGHSCSGCEGQDSQAEAAEDEQAGRPTSATTSTDGSISVCGN